MAGEMPRSERAIVAAGYDALGARFARWASSVADPARDEHFADFVGRLPSGARVLDVGCGSATCWTGGIATRFELTGIDVSAAQVGAARRNVPPATFFVADVTTLAFEDGAFDAAIALYSIGHLPAEEHAAVFARLARWLRPRGLLLASLPAHEDTGWTGAWIDGVEMFFASLGAARYEKILRDQGWRILEARAGVAQEPDGGAEFLWLLAEAPEPRQS